MCSSHSAGITELSPDMRKAGTLAKVARPISLLPRKASLYEYYPHELAE